MNLNHCLGGSAWSPSLVPPLVTVTHPHQIRWLLDPIPGEGGYPDLVTKGTTGVQGGSHLELNNKTQTTVAGEWCEYPKPAASPPIFLHTRSSSLPSSLPPHLLSPLYAAHPLYSQTTSWDGSSPFPPIPLSAILCAFELFKSVLGAHFIHISSA